MNLHCQRVPLILGLLFVTMFLLNLGLFGFYSAQGEDLRGNWNSKLFLDIASEEDLLDHNTTFSLSYVSGEMEFTSETNFTDLTGYEGGDSFESQKFGIGYRLGILQMSSDVVFEPREERLDYWLSTASISIGGFTFSDTFLLEYHLEPPYANFPGEYGSGMELSISGRTKGKIALDLSSRFGIKIDEGEQLGIIADPLYDNSSGYDIDYEIDGKVGENPDIPHGLSNFHYVGTTLEFSSLSLGCCNFNSTTEFTREEGFKITTFKFLIDSENLPLIFNTKFDFTPDSFSASIEPILDLNFGKFVTYFDLEKKSNSTYQPELEGLAVKNLKAGSITVNSVTSFVGGLYRARNALDVKLRAQNYLVDPDTPDPYRPKGDYYYQTKYDGITSLQSQGGNGESQGLSLGVDFYYSMSNETNWIFDLGMVTVDTMYSLEGLKLGLGMSFSSDSDATALVDLSVSF